MLFERTKPFFEAPWPGAGPMAAGEPGPGARDRVLLFVLLNGMIENWLWFVICLNVRHILFPARSRASKN
jgi:hypothetical protein